MNIWQHYEGDLYNVITDKALNEDGALTVVYAPLYHNADAAIFTQPNWRFYEHVEHAGQSVPRFKPVNMKDFLKP